MTAQISNCHGCKWLDETRPAGNGYTEMVRAILNGRKTVTRRLIKPRYRAGEAGFQIITNKHTGEFIRVEIYDEWEEETRWLREPYRPSDILYVRETWARGYIDSSDEYLCNDYWFKENLHPEDDYLGAITTWFYRADCDIQDDIGIRWRPSIYMPKEAARIFLRVTDVRVEWLQESFFCHGATVRNLAAEGIDIGDQCRECIETYGNPCCIDDESECGVLDDVRDDFARLWDSTVNPGELEWYGWAANPWVWVIEFERISREEARG